MPDDVGEELRALAQGTEGGRIVHDGADVGVLLGWNLAWTRPRPWVCIVHEDSGLQPGCAQRLLDMLQARPDAAAVPPRIRTTDGTPASHGSRVVVNFPTLQYDHSAPDKPRLPLDAPESGSIGVRFRSVERTTGGGVRPRSGHFC